MKLIDISTPNHPGTFAMVDDADFDHLNQRKWCLSRPNGYAVRMEGGRKTKITIYMHRAILKPSPGMQVDHINGNRLDNRRENLRTCTSAENNMNRRPTPGRALPKGVDWCAKDGRFRASIGVNKQTIHLGAFPTAAQAESARIEAAKKYHGEFARYNAITEDAK